MRRDSYRGVMLPQFGGHGRTNPEAEATVVLGLGFGDECKGMAVAHETGRAVSGGLDVLNVRFNGGPQAAHNVIVRTTDGRRIHHTHSQLGSGTMLGASTLLTDGMLVSPISLLAETNRLVDVTDDDLLPMRVMVEGSAPALLPFHGKANQAMEERRGRARHGSTGLGIGVARACEAATRSGEVDGNMLLTVSDLLDRDVATRKMLFWADWVERRFDVSLGMDEETASADSEWAGGCLREMVSRGMRILEGDEGKEELLAALDADWVSVVFEGSQGVLLDERHGWFPHVTYGDMTAQGALSRIGNRPVRVLGATRCYQTRHGAGPLPSEGTCELRERFNAESHWAGCFRTGLLDLPTLSRVARDVRVDALAVSCLDRYPGRCVIAWGGEERHGECRRMVPTNPLVARLDEGRLLEAMSDACGGIPVQVGGYGDVTTEWRDL